MQPFDFVNAINNGTKIEEELVEMDYVPFLTNRAFSYHKDSILAANELNIYNFSPKRAQFTYYLHKLRPRKRFAKWYKPERNDDIVIIQEYFKCGYQRAREYARVLTAEQINEIKNKKGGKP